MNKLLSLLLLICLGGCAAAEDDQGCLIPGMWETATITEMAYDVRTDEYQKLQERLLQSFDTLDLNRPDDFERVHCLVENDFQLSE